MKQIYEEYVQNTICFIGRRGRLRQDGGAQEEDEEREDDQEGCRPHRGTFSLSNVSLHCIQREGEEREKKLDTQTQMYRGWGTQLFICGAISVVCQVMTPAPPALPLRLHKRPSVLVPHFRHLFSSENAQIISYNPEITSLN